MIVKRGDTHVIRWKATADLTGATNVRLIARDGDTITILDATVDDPGEGVIAHTLTGTLPPGAYDVELEVTLVGQITTFPNQGYATLVVSADLA